MKLAFYHTYKKNVGAHINSFFIRAPRMGIAVNE